MAAKRRKATWNPAHHPRDAKGRFTRSATATMKPADRSRAKTGMTGFAPERLTTAAARREWLERTSAATPSASGAAIDAYLTGGWKDTNPALRAGKPVADLDQLDAAFTPIPDDVMLRRTVPLALFAHVPIDQLVGMKMRDAAPASAGLDHRGPGRTGMVTMHIAAPAGTEAYLNPDAGEVLLRRDTEIAITRAVQNDRGGWDLHGVVIPRKDAPAPAGARQQRDTDPAAAGQDSPAAAPERDPSTPAEQDNSVPDSADNGAAEPGTPDEQDDTSAAETPAAGPGAAAKPGAGERDTSTRQGKRASDSDEAPASDATAGPAAGDSAAGAESPAGPTTAAEAVRLSGQRLSDGDYDGALEAIDTGEALDPGYVADIGPITLDWAGMRDAVATVRGRDTETPEDTPAAGTGAPDSRPEARTGDNDNTPAAVADAGTSDAPGAGQEPAAPADTAAPGTPAAAPAPPATAPAVLPALPGGAATLADYVAQGQQATPANVRAVQAYVRAGMPRFVDEPSGITAEITEVRVGVNRVHADFVLTGPDGTKVGEATRSFRRGEVYHSSLSMNDDVRGAGFAQRFNDRNDAFYLQAGYDRVTLLANMDVGGYAWARAGYDFDDLDSAQDVARALKFARDHAAPGYWPDDVDLMIDQAMNADDVAGAPTPLAFAMIGWTPAAGHGKDAMWPGKELMLSTVWDGVRKIRQPAPAGDRTPEAPTAGTDLPAPTSALDAAAKAGTLMGQGDLDGAAAMVDAGERLDPGWSMNLGDTEVSWASLRDTIGRQRGPSTTDTPAAGTDLPDADTRPVTFPQLWHVVMDQDVAASVRRDGLQVGDGSTAGAHYGIGIYLSTDKATSDRYAGGIHLDDQIADHQFSAQARVQRPFRVDMAPDETNGTAVLIGRMADEGLATPGEKLTPQEITDRVRGAGYDSIYIHQPEMDDDWGDDVGGSQLVVFDAADVEVTDAPGTDENQLPDAPPPPVAPPTVVKINDGEAGFLRFAVLRNGGKVRNQDVIQDLQGKGLVDADGTLTVDGHDALRAYNPDRYLRDMEKSGLTAPTATPAKPNDPLTSTTAAPTLTPVGTGMETAYVMFGAGDSPTTRGRRVSVSQFGRNEVLVHGLDDNATQRYRHGDQLWLSPRVDQGDMSTYLDARGTDPDGIAVADLLPDQHVTLITPYGDRATGYVAETNETGDGVSVVLSDLPGGEGTRTEVPAAPDTVASRAAHAPDRSFALWINATTGEPVAQPTQAAMRRGTVVRDTERENALRARMLELQDADENGRPVPAAPAPATAGTTVPVPAPQPAPASAPRDRTAELAAAEAELAQARDALASYNPVVYGNQRTIASRRRVDATVRRSAELADNVARLERKVAGLRRPDAPTPPPGGFTAEMLAGVTHVRTRSGWHEVVKVNRASVKVNAEPGMNTNIRMSRIIEVRGGGTTTAPAGPAPTSEPADLAAAVASGAISTSPLPGGANAAVDLVEYGDGTRAVRKTPEANENNPVAPEIQADAEELGSLVALAAGARVPRVYRDTADTVVMDYVPGRPAGDLSTDDREQYVGTDSGRRLGLADILMGNSDRHSGNWIVGDDGQVTGIDHATAFEYPTQVDDDGNDVGELGAPAMPGSIFARQFLVPYGDRERGSDGWADNDFTPEEIAEVRARLLELQPQFAERGQGRWHELMMARADGIAAHARGGRGSSQDTAAGTTAPDGTPDVPDAPARLPGPGSRRLDDPTLTPGQRATIVQVRGQWNDTFASEDDAIAAYEIRNAVLAANTAAQPKKAGPGLSYSAKATGAETGRRPAARRDGSTAGDFAAMQAAMAAEPSVTSLARAEDGTGLNAGRLTPDGAAAQLDIDGGSTGFVPADRSTIGLSARTQVGRERSIAAVQQMGLFASDEQEIDGQGALLDALLQMPEPAAMPAGVVATPASADGPARLNVPDDLTGWTDEQMIAAVTELTAGDPTPESNTALVRIDDEWTRRETAMNDLAASIPDDLATASDADLTSWAAQLTAGDGPAAQDTVQRLNTELQARTATAITANETAGKRALISRPVTDLTDDDLAPALEAAADLAEWDTFDRLNAEVDRRVALDAEREQAQRAEAQRAEQERQEAAHAEAVARARELAGITADTEHEQVAQAMSRARAATAIPTPTEGDVRTSAVILRADGVRDVLGAERYDAIATAAIPSHLVGAEGRAQEREYAVHAALVTELSADEKARLVYAAADVDTDAEARSMSDDDLELQIRLLMFGRDSNKPGAWERRLKLSRESSRRKIAEKRAQDTAAFEAFQQRARTTPVADLTDEDLQAAPGALDVTDPNMPARARALADEAQRRTDLSADRAARQAAGPDGPARVASPVSVLGYLERRANDAATVRTYGPQTGATEGSKGREAQQRLRAAKALTLGLPETADDKQIRDAEKSTELGLADRAALTLAWYRHLGEFADPAEAGTERQDWQTGPADDPGLPEVLPSLPGAKVSKPVAVWEQLKQQALADRAAGDPSTARRWIMAHARAYGVSFDRNATSEDDLRAIQSAYGDAYRWDPRTEAQTTAALIAEFRRLAAEDGVDPDDTLRYGPADKRSAAAKKEWVAPTGDEQIRIDRLIAAGEDELDAYAQVMRMDADELRRRDAITAAVGTAKPNTAAIKGLYLEWSERQHALAEQATNGYLLNKRGTAAGVDPLTLFSGSDRDATRYASEELMRWWGENPRMTFSAFKAQILGDAAAAQALIVQGAKGNEFA